MSCLYMIREESKPPCGRIRRRSARPRRVRFSPYVRSSFFKEITGRHRPGSREAPDTFLYSYPTKGNTLLGTGLPVAADPWPTLQHNATTPHAEGSSPSREIIIFFWFSAGDPLAALLSLGESSFSRRGIIITHYTFG